MSYLTVTVHGQPCCQCLLYVCRIGLCARDYARVMVGNREAKKV